MKGQIRFAFRIIINQHSQTAWEKYIWESTYQEFLMQAQLFNDKGNLAQTFKELLVKNPKAEQLHFLVSAAAHPYILQWNGKIYHLADNLGNNFLPFNNYRFDIIDTNINDKKAHEIGITFYSPLLSLLDIWEGYYLISLQENLENLAEGTETFMYKMQPRLSVAFFSKQLSVKCN